MWRAPVTIAPHLKMTHRVLHEAGCTHLPRTRLSRESFDALCAIMPSRRHARPQNPLLHLADSTSSFGLPKSFNYLSTAYQKVKRDHIPNYDSAQTLPIPRIRHRGARRCSGGGLWVCGRPSKLSWALMALRTGAHSIEGSLAWFRNRA